MDMGEHGKQKQTDRKARSQRQRHRERDRRIEGQRDEETQKEREHRSRIDESAKRDLASRGDLYLGFYFMVAAKAILPVSAYDRVKDAALAEYSALRTEIRERLRK